MNESHLDRFERLDLAIRFAANAHAEQKRKISDIPFISHPFGVAMLLQRYGFPEDWVIAGLLHDIIEDTPQTLEEIRRIFGDQVADIIHGCSEPEHNTRPWKKRKQHTIDYLRTAPVAVKVVTCADKLHNVLSLKHDLQKQGNKIWSRFRHGKAEQAWYYLSVDESLRANLQEQKRYQIFADYSRVVQELFG